MLLVIREPKTDQQNAHNLRNKALNITIAMARFLVQPNFNILILIFVITVVFFVITTLVYDCPLVSPALLFFFQLVPDLVQAEGDWGVFHVYNVEACQVGAMGILYCLDDSFV